MSIDNYISDYNNKIHEEVLLRDIKRIENEIEDIKSAQNKLSATNKINIRKYIIPFSVSALVFLMAVFQKNYIIQVGRENVGRSLIINVKLSLGYWLTNLHRLNWIMLICFPFIVYFGAKCFGIYGYTPGNYLPEKVALFMGVKNYWSQSKQFEDELTGKRYRLSELKKELWELQNPE